jgi:ankyrin repeat protein
MRNIAISATSTMCLLAGCCAGGCKPPDWNAAACTALENRESGPSLDKALNNASVNVPCASGYSLLMNSVEYNNLNASKLLLKRGADVNYRDLKSSWTAAHVAANYADWQMMSLLKSYGADLASEDRHGSNPLDWATFVANDSAAAFLVHEGLPITRTNKLGNSPARNLAKRKTPLAEPLIKALRERGYK